MRKVLYGKDRFEGLVLDECLEQMASKRQAELEVMAAQRAAELEEQRQAKRAEKERRAVERNKDRTLNKARRLKWERKYRGK